MFISRICVHASQFLDFMAEKQIAYIFSGISPARSENTLCISVLFKSDFEIYCRCSGVRYSKALEAIVQTHIYRFRK